MTASLRQSLNGQRVSRETAERLDHFAALFQKWAKSINLVAPSTLNDLWTRHIADSAQIYQLHPGAKRWIDLGSGGGFPGIVTAIFLAELKDGWVHLVESNNKKAAFLRVALNETGARGSVHPVRIEEARKHIPTCDGISARALADLEQLLDYCSPWMSQENRPTAFFHKGRDYRAEVQESVNRWAFDLVEHPSVTDPHGVILELSDLRPV